MIQDLSVTRKEIDEVDRQMAALFEKRMELALEVAKYKIQTGKAVYDRERELQKLEKVGSFTHSDLNEKSIKELFQQIMSISRRYQYHVMEDAKQEIAQYFTIIDRISISQDTKVVFAGNSDTFTDCAMRTFFGTEICPQYVTSLEDLAKIVSEGNADYGVLPIEHSPSRFATGIYDVLDRFFLFIVGMQRMQRNQCLQKPFVIISNKKEFVKNANKVSISFKLPHTCGSLYYVLAHFIFNDINLTNIESIPIDSEQLEYCFFVDFDGNLSDDRVKCALKGIMEETKDFRILGSFYFDK